ncbi:hypothetical protein V1477_019422 [Vespula maculifrons]|uniref:Uncharacterized protein n=1 Tax=Vespula maculifrons TaxID=7453 RepID=A0ABD2ASI8_VESMC
MIRNSINYYLAELNEQLNRSQEVAKHNLNRAKERAKRYYDKKQRPVNFHRSCVPSKGYGWRISYCCCYNMNNLQLCTAISLPFFPSFATRYLICLFVDDCPIRRGTVIFESISFPDLLARDVQNIAF